MRDLRIRLVSLAALLGSSAVALAGTGSADGAISLPEPGVLELLVVAGVVGWVIKNRRGRK